VRAVLLDRGFVVCDVFVAGKRIGRAIQVGEAFERTRCVYAPFVESGDPRSTRSDRCDDESPLSTPSRMQIEETRSLLEHILSELSCWRGIPFRRLLSRLENFFLEPHRILNIGGKMNLCHVSCE